jgi:DNA-binding transcriptional ArsR family regulator
MQKAVHVCRMARLWFTRLWFFLTNPLKQSIVKHIRNFEISNMLNYKNEKESRKMAENIKQIASLFKALANENRLLVIGALLEQPLAVSEIAQRVPGISNSALSQHLSVLKAHGLLEHSKAGARVTYTLADQRVEEIILALGKFYAGELVEEEPDAADLPDDHPADPRHPAGLRKHAGSRHPAKPRKHAHWYFNFIKQH